MSAFEAVVLRDLADWQRNTVRLMLRQRRGDHYDVIMDDATWRTVEDGASLNDAGLILPPDALTAIAAAIAEHQGNASHADTEARVLREWLAVERTRVDAALNR